MSTAIKSALLNEEKRGVLYKMSYEKIGVKHHMKKKKCCIRTNRHRRLLTVEIT